VGCRKSTQGLNVHLRIDGHDAPVEPSGRPLRGCSPHHGGPSYRVKPTVARKCRQLGVTKPLEGAGRNTCVVHVAPRVITSDHPTARTAETIDEGTIDVLEALGYEW
jgi:hypothetical protein